MKRRSDLPLAFRSSVPSLSIRHRQAVVSQNGAAFRCQAKFVDLSAEGSYIKRQFVCLKHSHSL